MTSPHFYAVIIGTEILNGRRDDAHFSFVRETLAQRGHELYASFIIPDKPPFMENVYQLIKNDPNSVMFSFGGIGSTPDDYTREVAANVFTDAPIQRHEKFFNDIHEKFGEDAYPHRIHMADLPKNALLLKNVINNMSGFHLEERFFFVPGFPSMAHPMIEEALNRYYPQGKEKFRQTLEAKCSENDLIDVMKQIPEDIELSSLPKIEPNSGRSVSISLASYDQNQLKYYFSLFTTYLNTKNIPFHLS
jgi:molybdopterin-biosynthesis enzyme MoeA-like protein